MFLFILVKIKDHCGEGAQVAHQRPGQEEVSVSARPNRWSILFPHPEAYSLASRGRALLFRKQSSSARFGHHRSSLPRPRRWGQVPLHRLQWGECLRSQLTSLPSLYPSSVRTDTYQPYLKHRQCYCSSSHLYPFIYIYINTLSLCTYFIRQLIISQGINPQLIIMLFRLAHLCLFVCLFVFSF